MKVYTVQSDNFLDNIDSEGYIDNETNKEYSIFDYKNTIEALNWMTKKYEEKISSKIDKEMIWVWNNLRDSNFPTQENYYIYVFEVPMEYFKNKILWSDFIDWHLVLNQIEKNSWDDIFNVNPKKRKPCVQGVTTFLKKDWFLKKIKCN